MASSVQKDYPSEDGNDNRKASLKGPLFALLSTVACALSAEFTTLGHKGGVPGFQLLFFMRLTQLLTVLVCLPFLRPRLTGESRWQNTKLILLSVVINIGTTLMYLSFTYATPGIAFGIIQGTMPLFTACIGFMFLKETISLVSSCGILISITGVVLVAVGMGNQGANSTQQLVVSIALPLAAAFSRGPALVLIRALIKDISGLTIMLYITLLGTIAEIILTYTTENPVWTMSAQTAGYVAGLGLTEAVGALSFFEALKFEKAAIAVALCTLVVPFVVLLDYLFLSKVPGPFKWVGLFLVVLGSIILNAYTWWTHRQEEKRKDLLGKLDFPSLQSDSQVLKSCGHEHKGFY